MVCIFLSFLVWFFSCVHILIVHRVWWKLQKRSRSLPSELGLSHYVRTRLWKLLELLKCDMPKVTCAFAVKLEITSSSQLSRNHFYAYDTNRFLLLAISSLWLHQWLCYIGIWKLFLVWSPHWKTDMRFTVWVGRHLSCTYPIHSGLEHEMLDRHYFELSFRICYSESQEKAGRTDIEWDIWASGPC